MTDFTFEGRLKSLGFAYAGLKQLLLTQHKARIHAVATVLAYATGLWLGLSTVEWACLTLAVALVWMAEALNTGFEFVCDVVSPEFDERVRMAKDVAAGGVLIAACGAVGVGLAVFAPHLLALIPA